MRLRIELDGALLRANVRAYAALGMPIAAVVKNDAYRWGLARVAREIDEGVDSYVVADEVEFWALRMRTRRAIRLLAPVPAERLGALCAAGGIPNVNAADGIEAVAAHARATGNPVTLRVGIIDAAGWSGIPAADASAFAAACARPGLRVELWTHFASATRQADDARTFAACMAAFASAGADVVGTDVASTAWAQLNAPHSRLRIGAGLFGAQLGGTVACTCAIRVVAPVVEWFAPGRKAWAGYGDIPVPANRGVAVLRCGYGDGFPKKLAGYDDILSVGMQYTTRLADEPTREHALIDERTNLDELADRLGIGPHEIITGLAQRT